MSVKTNDSLSYREAAEMFAYNQDTGHISRKYPPSRRHKNGRTIDVGFSDSNGYVVIGVKYKYYKAHRLAWLLMTGEWPKNQIDHIDGIKSNNAWSNLREATQSQNQANTAVRKTNKTGIKGAHKCGSGWTSRIRVNGHRYFLGYFNTPESANAAYKSAAIALHGEFGRA